LEETPWHPRRFNPEVSDEFVDLIGDMMEKDPRQRIQSAAEVAERLAPWAADQSMLTDVQPVRSRWSTQVVGPDEGEQDTDDGAGQGSDLPDSDSSGSESSASRTGSGSLSDTTDIKPRPPKVVAPAAPPVVPPPVSVVEQFGSVRRLDSGEAQYTRTRVIAIGLACLGIGAAIGFVIAAYAII
jgi:serine/threonine protein kinase